MSRIVVDIGNSRCKSAVEHDGVLTPFDTFAWNDVFLNEVLEQVWLGPLNGTVPDSIHISNVAADRLLPNLDAWCFSI